MLCLVLTTNVKNLLRLIFCASPGTKRLFPFFLLAGNVPCFATSIFVDPSSLEVRYLEIKHAFLSSHVVEEISKLAMLSEGQQNITVNRATEITSSRRKLIRK